MLTKDCLNIVNKFIGMYNIKNIKELKILYKLFEDNYDNSIVQYNIINKDTNNDIKINNPYISNKIILC